MPARRYHHTGRAHAVPPPPPRGRPGNRVARRSGRASSPDSNRSTNAHGIHLLRSASVVNALVESAGLDERSLVLDLGAGPGTLTGRLAASGAKIIAIERYPQFVARLRRRFEGHPNVRIVQADLATVPFPGRRFQVVASIPYGLSTALVRRLLQPARTELESADLVVEWGFAQRVANPRARDVESAWWGARFEFEVVRRVPRSAFAPAPSVDSAHLVVRRRTGVSTEPRVLRALHPLLTSGYRDGARPVRAVVAEIVPRSRAARMCSDAGVAPSARAHTLSVAEWAALAREVGTAPVTALPRLPRHLDPRPDRRR